LSSRLSKERRPVCGSAINTIVLNFPVVDGGVATRYSGKPQIRGPVRNRPDQPHQSEAGRQANYAEGAATRRERCRSDGSSPAPRVGKGIRTGAGQGAQDVYKKTTEGFEWSEGNADADYRQGAAERDLYIPKTLSGLLGRWNAITARSDALRADR